MGNLIAYGEKEIHGGCGGAGGSGGGHIIQDAAGNELAQEGVLKFGGYLKTTDDSTNELTLVSDEPTLITWEAWNLLSTAQKQGTHWLITDVPISKGSNNCFELTNQTLTFANNIATISNSQFSTDTWYWVRYHDPVTAASYGIVTAMTSGTLTFTATNTPSTTVIVDILYTQHGLSIQNSAAATPYDNSQSGLTATDTQSAIDELASILSGLLEAEDQEV